MSIPEASPLDELEAEADSALELCWQRLAGQGTLDEEHLKTLIYGWRKKRAVFVRREELAALDPAFTLETIEEARQFLIEREALGRIRTDAGVIKKANAMWLKEQQHEQ